MSRALAALLRHRRASAGATLLLVLGLMGLLAPILTRWSPTAMDLPVWLRPSWAHPLGTTPLGQDIFAQLLHGARATLLIGIAVGIVTSIIAVTLGVAAAYFGGWVDEAITTVINVFLVLPGLPLLIVATAFLRGGGVLPVILVISFTGWAWGARVLRAQALALRGRDFVQAAVACGEGPARIIFAELLPNLAGLIAANFFGAALYAVLSEASLSFIGLGDVGKVTWGTMLYWAQAKGALLQGAWWWVVAPGLCIALLGTAFALLNFGIDELSNPRLNRAAAATRVLRPEAPAAWPAGEGPAPLLELRHLDAGYDTPAGPVRAVRDVSLQLQAGEFLGLAGESGCGKSTLAFAATRLLDPPGVVFDGEVRLDGADLLSASPAELRARRWRDFAVVFQASMNVLNPVLRVREQLEDVMLAHGVRGRERLAARSRELLALVGISPDYLNAYPHQLSGGMKQRVVIAIALALEPKLVVMDEPTTALDVVVQRQLLQEIDAVRRRMGIAVVFITHDLSLLVEIADRVAIMYAGELVEEAPARALYAGPRHPYTQRLMNAFPPVSGRRQRREGIPGAPPPLGEVLAGCPFFARCPSRLPGACDAARPPRVEVAPGHRLSCFLVAHPENDRVLAQRA